MKTLRKVLVGLIAIATLAAAKCAPTATVTCDKDGCRIEAHLHK